MRASSRHVREYAIEALSLGLFMVSAAAFATLLQHPASPLSAWQAAPAVKRVPMGIAMGSTLIAIIYSPLGARSGAHLNPALTLTFLRLGKVTAADALGYVAGQFAGGLGGIVAAEWALRGLPADASVNHVATVPGAYGIAAAFGAEAAMSFGMMLLVLAFTNTPRLARYTGVCAGALVALYITVEAPVSGMSMNPARTLGPALLAHTTSSLWIYFLAPLLGMAAAAELFVKVRSTGAAACAKLHHPHHIRCIFKCTQETGVSACSTT